VSGARLATERRGAVAGVVLAAGLGRRFGGGKLAAVLDGRPMIAHVLDVARSARDAGALSPIVVVAGSGRRAAADAATVQALAASFRLTLIRNDDPSAGLSRSLRLALTALETTSAQAALVLLGDQPRVRLDVIRLIVDHWSSAPPGIVIPRYGSGGAGNPVLLDRSVWPLAVSLQGDEGMIAVARERPDLVTYVEVEGANPDVDTPADADSLASGRSSEPAPGATADPTSRARIAGRMPPAR
jgi:CTP:molybdopterin cytidylyltransferase MocA